MHTSRAWRWYWYYLRYRVSTDGGRTYLFDEPIVRRARNIPRSIRSMACTSGRTATISATPVAGRSALAREPFSSQYRCLRLTRTAKASPIRAVVGTGSTAWFSSAAGRRTTTSLGMLPERIGGDGNRTARGLCEPTLARDARRQHRVRDARSNGGPRDASHKWPSHKWINVSKGRRPAPGVSRKSGRTPAVKHSSRRHRCRSCSLIPTTASTGLETSAQVTAA